MLAAGTLTGRRDTREEDDSRPFDSEQLLEERSRCTSNEDERIRIDGDTACQRWTGRRGGRGRERRGQRARR